MEVSHGTGPVRDQATAQEKVDFGKALKFQLGSGANEPLTPTEQKIVAIWSNLSEGMRTKGETLDALVERAKVEKPLVEHKIHPKGLGSLTDEFVSGISKGIIKIGEAVKGYFVKTSASGEKTLAKGVALYSDTALQEKMAKLFPRKTQAPERPTTPAVVPQAFDASVAGAVSTEKEEKVKTPEQIKQEKEDRILGLESYVVSLENQKEKLEVKLDKLNKELNEINANASRLKYFDHSIVGLRRQLNIDDNPFDDKQASAARLKLDIGMIHNNANAELEKLKTNYEEAITKLETGKKLKGENEKIELQITNLKSTVVPMPYFGSLSDAEEESNKNIEEEIFNLRNKILWNEHEIKQEVPKAKAAYEKSRDIITTNRDTDIEKLKTNHSENLLKIDELKSKKDTLLQSNPLGDLKAMDAMSVSKTNEINKCSEQLTECRIEIKDTELEIGGLAAGRLDSKNKIREELDDKQAQLKLFQEVINTSKIALKEAHFNDADGDLSQMSVEEIFNKCEADITSHYESDMQAQEASLGLIQLMAEDASVNDQAKIFGQEYEIIGMVSKINNRYNNDINELVKQKDKMMLYELQADQLSKEIEMGKKEIKRFGLQDGEDKTKLDEEIAELGKQIEEITNKISGRGTGEAAGTQEGVRSESPLPKGKKPRSKSPTTKRRVIDF